MNPQPNDGGPAFAAHSEWSSLNQNGMSLRDWFAGQALASIPLRAWDEVRANGDKTYVQLWSECAYSIADAMLAERQKGRI